MPSILIGVISDTHGLLRPEAMAALRGAEHIIHAGDVGSPEILENLAAIAPVTAVRGNVDKSAWARKLQCLNWAAFLSTCCTIWRSWTSSRKRPDLPPWSAATVMFLNKRCATECYISIPAARDREDSNCR